MISPFSVMRDSFRPVPAPLGAGTGRARLREPVGAPTVAVSTAAAARVAAAVTATVGLHGDVAGIGASGVSSVAVVAVVAGIGPERLVDGDTAPLERHDRAGNVTGAIVDTLLVGRCVMDELGAQLRAERGVLPRVEDEGVPANVHQRGGRIVTVWLVGAEPEEPESLIHDALREGELHSLVLDDPVNQALPKLVTDEALVR